MDEKEKENLEQELAPIFDKKIKEAEDKLAAQIEKRFTPGTDDEVIVNPEDELVKSKLGGFKSKAHFYNDVIKAGHGEISETLSRWNAAAKTTGYMEEGDLSQGGFTVAPPEILAGIAEKTLEVAIVRPRARIQPMGGNALEIIADVDDDHSANYFGGITIYRPGEGGSKTPTNPTYAKIGLKLHKVTGLCHVTDELLEDSTIGLEADLTRKFGEAIAFVTDDDFLNGTGANQPLGAFNSANPALLTVTQETGQGANTIVFKNIIKMWARLYPRGHANAVWVANIETFPQLAAMSMAVGTGGIPVWMPAGGVSGASYQTLMGAPLLYTEKMQALGTAGDIGLVDFSQYVIGEKGGVQLASSIHLKFDYDMTSFRFVLRYDGQPTWKTYLTPKRGSATLSPFVVLAGSRT